jgi:hypothetical protein
MKTFYSIVYAVITPETGEKIALGILLSNGSESLFRYSAQKLEALKHFIGLPEHSYVREYLKSVEQTGNRLEPHIGSISTGMETGQFSAVAEGYVDYLSNYNQNIISFGKPIQIDLAIEKEPFDRLFTAMIKEKVMVQNPIARHQIHTVKETFIPTVENFYTLDFEITPREFDSLSFPVKLDLLGKNEIPVFARFLDFEKAMNHIKSDFFDIDQVLKAISDVKGFVIASEPDRDHFRLQHVAWDRFRVKKDVEYLDLSEVDRVREYALTHGVEPWRS